jgi:hypothetical protein
VIPIMKYLRLQESLEIVIHSPISQKYYSYPQVYPQINVTDNVIRHPNSGVKWRIVVTGALLLKAFVIP